MKAYAQELNESVIWAHVDLYVNRWSLSLGEDGEQALRALQRVAGGKDLLIQHFSAAC
jgi:1,4-dihydroxy-6-naphthoate synthase